MLDGPMVSISAGRKQEKEMKEGERIFRSERYYGKVSRSFLVGPEADESKANAKCADGVLALTLAKKITSAAKRLVVD
jgi:HSP20 family protein